MCNLKLNTEEQKEHTLHEARVRRTAQARGGDPGEIDSIEDTYECTRSTSYYLDSVPMKIIRDECYLMSSLKLDINHLKLGYGTVWAVGSPLEDICLRLRFRSRKGDIETVTIIYKNKYSLWLWTLWVLLGLDLALRGDDSDFYGGAEYLPEFTMQSNHTITR